MQVLGWLKPSRSVPVTRWRSDRRWTGRPRTLAALFLGLCMYGAGDGLMVVSGLGVGPWTVLAEGASTRLSVSIGAATFIVSTLVLLLWIPLRERPGLGTISNIVLIATSLQVTVNLVPVPGTALAPTYVILGIALIGLGSGLYLTANLGPGARDGLMTGIHHRTGWPVVRIRLGIEVIVLAIGWSLGGTVGIGTIAFALFIGPSVGYGLMLAGRLGRVPGAIPTYVEEQQFPELDA